MPRPFSPKIVTANDLLEGDVVYLAADMSWVRALRDAEVLEPETGAEASLKAAQRQTDRVVGVYLADVRRGPHGPEPVHFREAFRARGPSNYPHGKQVDPEHV
jgi:hypothetical protein